MPRPMAAWNGARGVWETPNLNLLCGHLVPYWETLPTSGSMRTGRLYPRAMPGHRTAGSESSSSPGLLPTPTAKLAQDSQTHRSGARTDELLLTGVAKALTGGLLLPTPLVTNRAGMEPSPATLAGKRGHDLGPSIGALLKTPTAQLAVNGGSQHPDKRRDGGHGPTLADQIEHELLPTPRATDGTKGGPNQRGSSGDLMLPSAVMGLLPTPVADDARNASISCRSLNPGFKHGVTLTDAIALLPTPMAADGERMSLTMPRGNPTLIGALTDQPSADGKPSPDAQLPAQLSLDGPESA